MQQRNPSLKILESSGSKGSSLDLENVTFEKDDNLATALAQRQRTDIAAI